MEKATKQSVLQQKKDSLNNEIDKFQLSLKSNLKDLQNDINVKKMAEKILKDYIEHPLEFNGNTICSHKTFDINSKTYFNFYELNSILFRSLKTKEKLKELEPEIEKIIKEFLNNVIKELNNYSKDYSFYLIASKFSFPTFLHDEGITCNITFTVDFS